MPTILDKYAIKGNEFLSLLKYELNSTDDKALRILKCVLHNIRDHISWRNSLQLISQLPMMIKAVYVDQWNYTEHPTHMHHLYDLFDDIRAHDRDLAEYDLGDYNAVSAAAKAVFRTMNYYLPEGAMEDVIAVMPEEIKQFIFDSIGAGRMAM